MGPQGGGGRLFTELGRPGGLDHNFGQRRSVRTADPTIRPRSVGSAVRTNDLTAGAVVGIMIKAHDGLDHNSDHWGSRPA